MGDSRLNLFQKIQGVANEIRSIEKNMTIGIGDNSYKAVSDYDVVTAVKEAETKYKIMSVPFRQELIKTEVVQVQKKDYTSNTYVDVVKMTTRIYDLENTESFLDIESFGRGLDGGDKGFGKASTYARKYALLNVYKIATGEDPDKDKSKEEKVVQKDEKRDIVINYLLKDNVYMNNVLGHFNLPSTDDLNSEQIRIVYNTLTKRGLI